MKKEEDHYCDSVDAESDVKKMEWISQPKDLHQIVISIIMSRIMKKSRKASYHDYCNTQSLSISVHNRVPHEITQDLQMK